MFQTFERLLDTPALMVERAELTGPIALAVQQRSHQHTAPPVWRDVADKPYTGWRAREFVVPRVALIRRRQYHHALGLGAAGKGSDTLPVAGIDTHAERDVALAQCG